MAGSVAEKVSMMREGGLVGCTEPLDDTAARERRPLRLTVISGADRGRSILLKPYPLRVGKDPSCDLVLSDATVSAVHLDIIYGDGAVTVRDLGSRNGSFYAGARFETLQAGRSATITIGKTQLQIELADAPPPMPASPRTELHGLIGRSEVMRRVFTLLERAAASDVTVLVEGETGTGKELAAAALHALSRRRGGPFVVCDLASLPGTLAESELFGHVRGAFTGADRDRVGAFELAHGGTVFLDEIGELPIEVQPRLLRVLQERQVRRIGASEYRKVDVRVVAATNRDLGDEVRAGRFRADLYHRLSTVAIHLPALRDRPDDVPALAEHFLRTATEAAGRPTPALDRDFLDSLAAHDWPGNIRELRNVLERAVALSGPETTFAYPAVGLPVGGGSTAAAGAIDPAVPFHEAKAFLIDTWERQYLAALLAASDRSIKGAARRSGLHRAHLHRLLKKHGLE
jgi:transcriptional regulator with GAF, ATPase, and Fis domain